MKYLRGFFESSELEISKGDCLDLGEYFQDFEDEIGGDVVCKQSGEIRIKRGEIHQPLFKVQVKFPTFESHGLEYPKGGIDSWSIINKFTNCVTMMERIGEFSRAPSPHLNEFTIDLFIRYRGFGYRTNVRDPFEVGLEKMTDRELIMDELKKKIIDPINPTYIKFDRGREYKHPLYSEVKDILMNRLEMRHVKIYSIEGYFIRCK